MSKSQEEIDSEYREQESKLEKRKEEDIKDIMKYFNRIHDKLFSINTILLGAIYFFYNQNNSTSLLLLFLPIINVFILIFIEYHNMKTKRLDASQEREIKKGLKREMAVTLLSLVVIIITIIGYISLSYTLIKVQ